LFRFDQSRLNWKPVVGIEVEIDIGLGGGFSTTVGFWGCDGRGGGGGVGSEGIVS
jgi:hypothetical protein